jgi:hypothetical protein
MKAYETLLELDAGGSEFNLACILLGLERRPGKTPTGASQDDAPLVGRARAASTSPGRTPSGRRQVPAAQAVLNPEADVAARDGGVGLHRLAGVR